MPLPGDQFPAPPNETQAQRSERLHAIARAAFSGPAQQEPDNSIGYDGDGGRGWRESRGLE